MKVLVIGNFGSVINNYSGQTERTKAVYNALEKIQALKLNKLELGVRKTPFQIIKLITRLIIEIPSNEIFVVVAAQNGVSSLIKLFAILNIESKVIIIPTGGWFKIDKFSINSLRKFKAIIIQSKKHYESIKENLPDNTHHLPNFRSIYSSNFLSSQKSKQINQIPKIIYNSRVTASKGIYELISAIQAINEDTVKFTLDIYGQITREEHKKLKQYISSEIKYRGEYSPENVTEILNNYDILAFPTYYPGEGQPGVLLDALFNKLPVIATDWNFNHELVVNNYNGFLICPGSKKDLLNCLRKYHENPELIHTHSLNAEILARDFLFENNIEKLKNLI